MVAEHGAWRVAAIPVLQDNFVYVVSHGRDAVVVDAGASAPVLAYIRETGLVLRDVLLTHQHRDHTAGVADLQALIEPMATSGPIAFEVLSLPGHTAGDVGYYFAAAGVVCTGDCLINGACGRVLGGSMQDLFQSLQRIKALPGETRILGGHDYLKDNLRFALQHQSDNPAIHARRERYASDPAGALFATLDEEWATNPFLQATDLDSFTRLREAKDCF